MINNKDAFRDYLQLEKNYSLHTVNAYLNDISFFESFNKNQFDQQNIDQVNYSQIRTWIVSLVDDNISNVSVNRKIQSLKAYYKFLLRTKQIEINPLLKHKALKTPKTLQIPFTQSEVYSVLEQMQDLNDFETIRNKIIIDLFYSTGIRRAELIHLKMNSYDVSNQNIKVIGKRNKERIVPLLGVISKQLDLYINQRSGLQKVTDSDYLFLTKSGLKLSNSFVYRLINSYFSTVSNKVKKSPHVLRHSFATHLLNNGADLNSVKELLGHSSLASTQVYTHSSLSELKKVYKESHPRNKSK